MIKVVDTPNPDTRKFVFDDIIVGEGSKEFKKKDGRVGCAHARRLRRPMQASPRYDMERGVR